MGSFLNQGSHNKKTLMEEEDVVIVIGAIECNKSKEFIKIEKEIIPIAMFSGKSEDYGYLSVAKQHTLIDMFLKMEEIYLDDLLMKSGLFWQNLDVDSQELSPHSEENAGKFNQFDEMSMGKLIQFIHQDKMKNVEEQEPFEIVNKIFEKMKNGLVVKSKVENRTYQLVTVLFEKKIYRAARSMSLLLEDGQEIDLKTFAKKEVDRVFQETNEKFETFSKEWFEEFQNNMAHELYFTPKIFMVAENDKKFKKEMLDYYKDALELKYVRNLGLTFSQTVYAGQDYGNEIGKEYKKMMQVVQKLKVK